MTSIFKKSLACCLAVVLCLTCMLGALTVSAAEVKEGTFTVENATVTPGTATADVKITIDAEAANVIIMQVETEAGAVTAVRPEDATMQAVLDANSKKIYVSNGDNNIAPFNSVVVYVTVTLANTEAEAEYDVVAKLISASSNVEDEFAIADAKGQIIVKAEAPSHVHTPAEAVVENEVAATCTTDGSYDLVVYCSDEACKAEISRETKTVAAKGHVEGELVSATAAVADGPKGEIVFKCATCGANMVEEVGYEDIISVFGMEAYAQSKIMMKYSTELAYFPAGYEEESTILSVSTNNTQNGTPDIEYVEYADSYTEGDVLCWDAGVAAYQMTENTVITVFGKVNGKWYSGWQAELTFAQYAKSLLSAASTPANIKTVLVDLLNFGSTVQTLTGYNVEALANKGFDAYQSLGTDTSVSPDAASDVDFEPNYDAPIFHLGYSMVAKSRIEAQMEVYIGKADADTAVYVAEYTDNDGAAHKVAYVVNEVALATLGDVEFDKVYTMEPSGTDMYYANFAELTAYEAEKGIEFTLYGNGVAYETLSFTIKGIAAYTKSLFASSPNHVAAYDALIRYCNAAKAVWGK